MSERGATPLFIDTGGLYAVFDEDDAEHARAQAVFDAIRAGELAYRPIYMSAHTLSELVTLILARTGTAVAAEVLQTVRTSPNVTVLHPDAVAFDAACEQFEQYDDHDISLVDHLTGVLADERNVEHVFAFDSDFATLGLTRVPVDTGGP
ncbi:type II toxin-antitoxin system VapC family toxin [Halocatena marina]|uniref:Type II toxin-antitoxin system VapC family toxin n=1 Tax=Halocatena marina TaxID=2934937 RepID=A0ABD5YU74_9EURY|nr:PIN domain-containing protein [Halocatena marina]